MRCITTIIFDMDGVLFDTETFYYHRREKFLAEKGISIKHLPASVFIGGNMKQLWPDILGDDYEQWDIGQLQEDYASYKRHHPLPYQDLLFPDTRESIQRLYDNGYRLGLASSSSKHDILQALAATNLRQYFSVVLSGEEFPMGKPHPAIYHEASRQLGEKREHILVVEDSEKGIAAAVAAGLQVWAIKDRQFGMNQSQANRMIDNLLQLVGELLVP